jgi:ribonuclease HI
VTTITTLYADGGVIGPNPSGIGVTWAWRGVDAAGQVVQQQSGLYLCSPELPTLGNNFAELLAVVEALEDVPGGWAGTVCSDSQVTLGRVFRGWRLKEGVPPWLAQRLRDAQARVNLAACRWVLLDGHPTQAQLVAGCGKRGNPVSEHNVACDEHCSRIARAFLKGRRAA